MNHSYPGVFTHTVRGIGYASISLGSIISGYLIQSKSIMVWEFILLLIPLFLSIFFFISYAKCFPYQTERIVAKITQAETIKTYPIIGILFSIIIFLLFYIKNNFIPFNLLASFIGYGGLFFGYAIFLLGYHNNSRKLTMRHQLVWPAILTVAISLYFGLYFQDFNNSLFPFISIIPLLIYFGISEFVAPAQFSKKIFLLSGILTFLFFIFLTMIRELYLSHSLSFMDLWFNDLIEYFSAMVFCVAIAAYLAVFESWRITSYIAHSQPTKATQYFFATLGALIVSILIIPFVYILSTYGILFLIGFSIHAFLSFVYWSSKGKKIDDLITIDWISRKNIAGFVFLVILVSVSIFDYQPDGRYRIKDLVSFSGLGFLALMATPSIMSLYKELENCLTAHREPTLSRFFSRRINFWRSLSISSLIICGIIIILQIYQESSSSSSLLFLSKSDHAYAAYAVFIILSLIAEGYTKLRWSYLTVSRLSGFFIGMLGILQTTRIFTSSIISISVMVPALFAGNSFLKSLSLSFPFWLAAMGGFALNDYYDASRDHINKPYRVIPSGKLSSTAVLIIASALLITALICSTCQYNNKLAITLYIAAIIGVIVYNGVVKYFSLSKNIYTAALCVLPILYDILIFKYSHIYLSLPIATFLFIIGRELLMDIQDIHGDKSSGLITLPMILGEQRTGKIGFLFQFLGALILLPITIIISSPWNTLILSFIVVWILISSALWWYKSGRYQYQIIMLLWVPMLLGTLMLVT